MSVFKRAMSYLGLGPEDAYDDYDLDEEPERPMRGRSPYAPEPEPSAIRTVPSRPAAPREREPVPARFPSPTVENDVASVRPVRQGSAVRTVPANVNARPHTVRPRRFDQAQEVGDRFKEGQPVIVNLQDIDRELSRRIIDFCAGLCYALDGKMEKVANGVYLLTPANATVSPEDRRLMGEFRD